MPPAAAQHARRAAILIANQDYPEETGFPALKCPRNDVEALDEVLRDPHHGGFSEVVTLIDRDRRDILIELKRFLDRAEREDLVFVYFSGHGKPDEDGDLYFAARNTQADFLPATGIDARDISDMIRKSAVSKKALVLDCCYAGAFVRSFKADAKVVEDKINAFSRGSGTYILMATGELALAEEDPKSGLSALTRYMVEGLRGAADVNRDGFVTLNELSKYVQTQVAANYNQKPTEAGLDIQGEVAISRSGIEPEAEMRAKVKLRLLEWSHGNLVANEVLADALRILDKGVNLDGPAERGCRRLLDRIVEEDLAPGPFLFEWFTTRHAPPEPPPEPEAAAPEPPPSDPAGGPWEQAETKSERAPGMAEAAATFEHPASMAEGLGRVAGAALKSAFPGIGPAPGGAAPGRLSGARALGRALLLILCVFAADIAIVGVLTEMLGFSQDSAFIVTLVAVPLAVLLYRARTRPGFSGHFLARAALVLGAAISALWGTLFLVLSLNAF